jgi:redox-sensitive bicupin YhaK (pirin superfamily)
MVQLWVNLPAKDKQAPPHYQAITAKDIPQVQLADNAGTVRVIAGKYSDVIGPAQTFTPINLWDLRLNAGHSVGFSLPEGHTTLLLALSGRVELASGETLGEAELAIFDRGGDAIAVRSVQNAKLLLLGGEPIDESVAAYGPFVMNTQAEIRQAIEDYQAGRMGQLVSGANPDRD